MGSSTKASSISSKFRSLLRLLAEGLLSLSSGCEDGYSGGRMGLSLDLIRLGRGTRTRRDGMRGANSSHISVESALVGKCTDGWGICGRGVGGRGSNSSSELSSLAVKKDQRLGRKRREGVLIGLSWLSSRSMKGCRNRLLPNLTSRSSSSSSCSVT